MIAADEDAALCPLVGATVDQYDVIGLLGYGAMGCVYRVRHRVLQREYALKMLASDRVTSEVGLQRFQREAYAAAQIEHPNVVRVVYSGIAADGQAYLVMELLEGEALSTLVARGPLLPNRAAEITKQVALGLEEIHRRGFVHRDIKPTNLWVCPDGTVKILDLGVVGLIEPDAAESRLTRQGVLMGTPVYMAPEAFTPAGVDARGDLYALGVVLYELLSGRRPFEGTMKEILWHHHFTVPAPLPPSEGLETLALSLLAKSADERIQTAREVVERIEALGRASVAPRVEVTPPQARRGWAIGAAVGVAVAVLGVIVTRPQVEVEPVVATPIAAPPVVEAPVTPPAPKASPTRTASAVVPVPPRAPRRASAPPASPREVLLTSDPPGARVETSRGVLGMTPITVMLESGRSNTFRLRLEGRKDTKLVIGAKDRQSVFHVRFE